MDYKINRFNPDKVNKELWDKYYTFNEEIDQELNPKDPLPNRELDKSFILDPSPFYSIYRWLVFTNDENPTIIGKANLWFQNDKSPDYNNVKDKAHFYISIKKEYRRNKIASELLKVIGKVAQDLGKSILRGEITDTEGGVAFCKFHNGSIVAKRAQNRLYLKDINWDLMNNWREIAKEKAKDVTLETFEKVPDKYLIEYCNLYTETMNQAPAEDLTGEMIISPERRRIEEKTYSEKGCSWITIVTRESSGVLSGLTEIFYHPSNSHWVEQELTGVKEDYRGRGLGKWLKAEMLFYIKDKFPNVQYLQTGNNDNNKAMLSINNRMGYKRHKSETFFEFKISDLKIKK